MRTRTKGILFASIAALMWGILAIALKVALNYLPAETLAWFGFIYGLSFTSPGSTQFFIQTGPLLLAIIGIFLFKEKIGMRKIAGFIIVSLGFVLFYYEQIRTTIVSMI